MAPSFMILNLHFNSWVRHLTSVTVILILNPVFDLWIWYLNSESGIRLPNPVGDFWILHLACVNNLWIQYLTSNSGMWLLKTFKPEFCNWLLKICEIYPHSILFNQFQSFNKSSNNYYNILHARVWEVLLESFLKKVELLISELY